MNIVAPSAAVVVSNAAANHTRLPELARATDSLIQRLIQGVDGQIRDAIGLWDPLIAQPTPGDHYGQAAAALALFLNRERARSSWRVPLKAWLDQPRTAIGHEPFVRFLLLLLKIELEHSEAAPDDRAMVDAAIRRAVPLARYPSNNWSMLAALCELIVEEGRSTSRGQRRLERMAMSWFTARGGFIDFPSRPARSISTPIVYHFKALLVLSVALQFVNSPVLDRQLRAGIAWVSAGLGSDGLCGGFGRSNYALFGDACLLSSLLLTAETNAGEALGVASISRIVRQFRNDDLLWLNPAGSAGATASWDSYMYLSVYNAWTAALLSWALTWRKRSSVKSTLAEAFHWPACPADSFEDRDAGLLVRTSAGGTAMFSTSGQLPQAWTSLDCEFRYAGGIPYHLSFAGSPVVAPPVRVDLDSLVRDPPLAGWTPVVQAPEGLFAIDEFDEVETVANGTHLRLILSGRAVALVKPTPRGIASSALAAIDWRLLNGRVSRSQVLRRPRIEVRGRLAWDIDFSQRSVTLAVRIENDTGSPISWLNPAGHSVIGEKIARRLVSTYMSGTIGPLLLCSDSNLRVIALPTSLPGGEGAALPAVSIGSADASEATVSLEFK